MRLKADATRHLAAIARILRLDRRSSGQTMGEYALILAAVALIAYAGFQILGNDINDMMSSLGSNQL